MPIVVTEQQETDFSTPQPILAEDQLIRLVVPDPQGKRRSCADFTLS